MAKVRRYNRILLYGNERTFGKAIADTIFERDGGLCVYCGEPGQEVDHVIPYSKGGPTIRANGVVSCYPCNHAKQAKLNLSTLTRAFNHLLTKGESLSWLDDFWDALYSLRD